MIIAGWFSFFAFVILLALTAFDVLGKSDLVQCFSCLRLVFGMENRYFFCFDMIEGYIVLRYEI